MRSHDETHRDASGFAYFDHGELGRMHVSAHQLMSARRYEDGRKMLAEGLHDRACSDSRWIHLQWHLMVFELATGEWASARRRFERHIADAFASGYAPTDGPSAMWRLQLDAPSTSSTAELPWEAAREIALAQLRDSSDAYVELHALLALAGAADVINLDRWLRRHKDSASPILVRMAEGLRAFAATQYLLAAALFTTTLSDLRAIGGSEAQNEIFLAIQMEAWRRARRELMWIAA